jgi:hypothetical protein
MTINDIRKTYQEAVKSRESEVLDKIRKSQADGIIQKAIEDAISAAKKLEKNINFTFGAHPVTSEYSIAGLRTKGFNVIVTERFHESDECVISSLILSGWADLSGLEKDTGSHKADKLIEKLTSVSEEIEKTLRFNEKVKGIISTGKTSIYSFDNATEISKKMKEANRNANIDTELIRRVITRGFKGK